MELTRKYYAYRANLAFEDLTLFNYEIDDNKINRNRIFRNFFDRLEQDKLKSSYATREYFLLYVDKKQDIVYCKLARKKDVSLKKMENYKIIEKNEEEYPFVNVFVDLKTQKFLIESNTSVFTNYITAKKTIENIIRNNIKEQNAIITLNPITKENEFKKYLIDADYIYYVKFKLNTPNFLDGRSTAEEWLSDIHEKTAGDEVELTIKNNSGKLNLKNTGISSFVRYAECGAGTWELKYKGDEKRRTIIKSGDLAESIDLYLDIFDQDYLNVTELEVLNEAFKKVEKVEKFRKNTNEERI